MNPAKDVIADLHGIAITAFLKASGGQATIHAKDLGIALGDYLRAVRRLQMRGVIEHVGECEWRMVA